MVNQLRIKSRLDNLLDSQLRKAVVFHYNRQLCNDLAFYMQRVLHYKNYHMLENELQLIKV